MGTGDNEEGTQEMKKYSLSQVSGFLVSAALNERMTALSLPLLRIVHTDRDIHIHLSHL